MGDDTQHVRFTEHRDAFAFWIDPDTGQMMKRESGKVFVLVGEPDIWEEIEGGDGK